MRRIGFIGLGNIGRPMVERLLDCGFDVLACDIDEGRLQALSERGARISRCAGDCAGEEMVIVMVASDAQLHQASLGSDGLLSAIDSARAPRVAVMSTVLPETVRNLAAPFGERGAQLVDAPVSGGAIRARDGRLTIMTGGRDADIEVMQPVLDRLGSTIHRCGPLGSGMLTKLLNNLVGVTNHYLLAETMLIARRYGMDQALLATVMEASSGRCSGTRDWAETRDLYRASAASLESLSALAAVTRKDLSHALELARQAGVLAPLLAAAAAAHGETPVEKLHDIFTGLLA